VHVQLSLVATSPSQVKQDESEGGTGMDLDRIMEGVLVFGTNEEAVVMDDDDEVDNEDDAIDDHQMGQ
jgi:hypothetical protein